MLHLGQIVLPIYRPTPAALRGVSLRGVRLVQLPASMVCCFVILTTMPKTKVAVTLDATLLDRLDDLVSQRRFRNRSQAVEAALAEKLERLTRTRLARECAKLDPAEEQRAADESLAASGELWPEY